MRPRKADRNKAAPFIRVISEYLNMRATFGLFALVSVAVLLVPAALAEEIPALVDAGAGNETANATPGYATAIGHVYVNLTEPEPGLAGFGAGLFSYSAFDFGGFFRWISEVLSSLLGLQM
jgi:hypothetical protein